MAAAGGEEQSESVIKLMDVITMSLVPAALNVAVRLKVMDILAEHGGADKSLSADEIASHLETPLASSTSLDRMLRLLASHGLLASSSSSSSSTPAASSLITPQGIPITTTYYSLNSHSRLLFHPNNNNNNKPSLAPFLLFFHHPSIIHTFFDFPLSLLDGEIPFTKAHGANFITYITKHNHELGNVFNQAMANLTNLFMYSLLDTYNGFHDISTLLDIGGGIGTCLAMIVSKYPHIKGINFDLPEVVAAAPSHPGVEHVGGDMFETIPKADVIFMKWILHGCSDADCIKLLQNCHKSLPSKGKVILVDCVLPEEVECGNIANRMDMVMFLLNGAKERSKREIQNISKASGFSRMQEICNIHAWSVMELHKGPPYQC